jgi:hypothetical protein
MGARVVVFRFCALNIVIVRSGSPSIDK